jgi:hypothetical protein
MMGPIPEFPMGYRLPSEVDLAIRASAALRLEAAAPRAAVRPRTHRLVWRRRPVAVPQTD